MANHVLNSEIDQKIEYMQKRCMTLDKTVIDIEKEVKDIITQCNTLRYHKGLFASYKTLAKHYILLFNDEEALAYLKKAKTLIDYKLVDQVCYGELSLIFIKYYADIKNDYEEANRFYKLGMKYATKYADAFHVTALKSNFGTILMEQGKFDESLILLEEAKEYLTMTNQERYLVFVCDSLAQANLELGNYKKAKKYYQLTNRLSIKYEDLFCENLSTIGLAKIMVIEGQSKAAIEVISKFMNKAHSLENPAEEAKTAIEIARIYQDIGLFEKAYFELDSRENFVECLLDNKHLYDYYTLFSEVCGDLRKYKKAFLYSKKAFKIHLLLDEKRGAVLVKENLNDSYKEHINLLKTLSDIGHDITTFVSLDDVALELNLRLKDIMKIDSVGIGEIRKNCIYMNHFYLEGCKIEPLIIPLDDSSTLASWVVQNDEEVVAGDIGVEYSKLIERVKRARPTMGLASSIDSENKPVTKSVLYKPIKFKDEFLGVFTLQTYQEDAYGSEEIEIFRILSSYVSVVIKNVLQANALIEMSMRDHLTGLYNRRGFMDMYNVLLEDKTIQVSNSSLIMLDVDRFKRVNDKYGHLMGDKVLEAFGQALTCMSDDLLYPARLGGEEFGFIVLNRTFEEAKALAEKLRKDIEQLELRCDGIKVPVTASVGVAYCGHQKIVQFHELYHKADKLLYVAKEERNKMLIDYV